MNDDFDFEIPENLVITDEIRKFVIPELYKIHDVLIIQKEKGISATEVANEEIKRIKFLTNTETLNPLFVKMYGLVKLLIDSDELELTKVFEDDNITYIKEYVQVYIDS